MDVRIASENDKENWNHFVDQEGGSFHLYYEWKYYYEKNAKKHRFIPLILENTSAEILGIFPIEENLRSIYGTLTSLPLGVSNGFLIKGDLEETEKNLAIRSFLNYVEAHLSKSHALLTIRERLSFSGEHIPPTQVLLDYGYVWLDNTTTGLPCAHVLKLEKPFEQKIWMDLWDKSLRRRIRQARKNGAVVVIDHDFKYLDEFAEMQLQSYEKFGYYPTKEDITSLFTIFRDKIKLFVCLVDSEPISGALCYYTPTVVHCSMAPYTPAAMNYLTNTLPVCSSIRDACEQGYQYFDNGLTSTQEIAHHKEKFGAKKIPLRIYTKTFSSFKVTVNDRFDNAKQYGKKILRSFRT